MDEMDRYERIFKELQKVLSVTPCDNTKFLLFEFGIEVDEYMIFIPEELLN